MPFTYSLFQHRIQNAANHDGEADTIAQVSSPSSKTHQQQSGTTLKNNFYHGKLFNTISNPPTVTFTAVKALMMGSRPSYVDAFLNLFSSPENLEEWNQMKNTSFLVPDSFISRMKLAQKSIIMHGDESYV